MISVYDLFVAVVTPNLNKDLFRETAISLPKSCLKSPQSQICRGAKVEKAKKTTIGKKWEVGKAFVAFFVKLGATYPCESRTCQNPSDQTIGDEKNRKKKRAKRDLIYKPEFVETYLIKCSSQY